MRAWLSKSSRGGGNSVISAPSNISARIGNRRRMS